MSKRAMDRVLRGPDAAYDEEPIPAFPGVYSGTVTKVNAKGLYFTIPSYDRDLQFGPAPWPRLPTVTGETVRDSAPDETADFAEHDHPLRATYGDPPKGTQVAVAFGDGEADQPLVLALYGWPA